MILGRLCCAALVVAACRASPPPKPSTVARPAQSPTKIEAAQAPTCVTVPDEGAAITQAIVVDGTARYCVGEAGTECFQMSLDAGVLGRLAEPPVIEETKGARVEMTPPELKICEDDGCQSLTPKVLPAAARIRGATNTNGSFAVFLLGDANAGKGYAEIWNVDKTKKAATFRYARGDFRCGEVAMVGDTVYVAATQCGQPAARAALYSLKGRKLGNVGGRDFGMYGNAFAHVAGTNWAFLEENGAQLAIQDVAKGKVKKLIDLGALWRSAGVELGNPGESTVVRLADNQLAVIAGAPAAGSVALVDALTGDVTVFAAARCD